MTTRPAPALLWLTAAAFLVLGALQASYGPSFAGFQARYGLSSVQVSGLFTATFVAQLLATLGSGWVLGRLAIRRTVRLGLGLVALGLLGVALAPAWALTLGGAVVAGVGYGLLSVALNLSLARQGARAALTLVNAAFGLGSILGPLLVAGLAARGVWAPYAVLGGLAVLLTLASRAFPQLPPAAPPPAGVGRSRAPLGTLLLFNLLLTLYVGLEASAGGWMARALTPGYGAQRAAALVSLYWLSFTLGRALLAGLAGRLAPRVLTVGALALGGLTALLTQLPAGQLGGYVLLGLVIAPVYPTAFAWLVARVPERYVNFGLLGTGSGAAFVPPLVGLGIASGGLGVLPLALAGVAFAATLTALVLAIRERR